MQKKIDLFQIFGTRRNWFQRSINDIQRYFAQRGKMTVRQYLEKYGAIQIIDKDRQKAFISDPERIQISGSVRAGDVKRVGIF